MDSIQKINEYIKSNMLNALLPQNLNDEVFEVLREEAKQILSENEEASASSILLVLFALKSKKYTKMFNEIELQFEEDELMHNMYLYCISMNMEDKRRKRLIKIPDNFLPTLDNIFDIDREMQIERLYE